MHRFTLTTLIAGALALGAPSHSSSEYSIDWFVIGAGGGVSTGGDYELRGVIGQPLAHAPTTEGEYTITGGFLAIPTVIDPPSCPGDANGDNQVNFTDLNAVLSAFGQSGAPGFSDADLNNDGVVNFADLNAVLSAFGATCA
jgi:hypothetical protein